LITRVNTHLAVLCVTIPFKSEGNGGSFQIIKEETSLNIQKKCLQCKTDVYKLYISLWYMNNVWRGKGARLCLEFPLQ